MWRASSANLGAWRASYHFPTDFCLNGRIYAFSANLVPAVTKVVYPAYQKLIDYFNGLLPKTTTDDGVCFHDVVLRSGQLNLEILVSNSG